MATSGSIDFTVTVDDIITDALELIGVLGEGDTATTDQVTSAMRTLNMLVKTWQAAGLNLFAVQRTYLFLEKTVSEYDLSNSPTTANYSTSVTRTETTADAVATATTVFVETGIFPNFASGDNVGIYLNQTSLSLFWTTATAYDSGTGELTISTGLPEDITSGGTVYYYRSTDIATRPMYLLEAYLHQFDGVDIPIDTISRIDYNELTNKDSVGFINQVYYDPQTNTTQSFLSPPKLYTWPTTDTEQDYLILFVQRTTFDLDATTDNPDIPQEWYMPLVYNLAKYIAPKYGIPSMDYTRLETQATELYSQAFSYDIEKDTSMYIKPDSWGNERR